MYSKLVTFPFKNYVNISCSHRMCYVRFYKVLHLSIFGIIFLLRYFYAQLMEALMYFGKCTLIFLVSFLYYFFSPNMMPYEASSYLKFFLLHIYNPVVSSVICPYTFCRQELSISLTKPRLVPVASHVGS